MDESVRVLANPGPAEEPAGPVFDHTGDTSKPAVVTTGKGKKADAATEPDDTDKPAE